MCSARISLLLFSICLLLNIKSVSLSNVKYQEMTATAMHFYEHYYNDREIEDYLPAIRSYCNNSTLTAKYGQSHSLIKAHKGLCIIVWAYDTSTRSDETEDFAVIYTDHKFIREYTIQSIKYDRKLMEDELFSRWAVNSMSREDYDRKIANNSIILRADPCVASGTYLCNSELLTQSLSMMLIKRVSKMNSSTKWDEGALRRFWWRLYGNNGTDYDYNLYTTIADGKDPFEEEQSPNTKEKTKKKSIAPNRLLLSEDQVDGFQDPFEEEQSSNTKEKTEQKSIAPNRLLLSEDQVDGFQALGLTTVAVALIIILYYLIICLVVYTYRNRIFVNFT